MAKRKNPPKPTKYNKGSRIHAPGRIGEITCVIKGRKTKYEVMWSGKKLSTYTEYELEVIAYKIEKFEPEQIEDKAVQTDLLNFSREQDFKVGDRILLKNTSFIGRVVDLDKGTIAWENGTTSSCNTLSKTYFKKCSPSEERFKCLDNSTCAAGLAQDSHSPDSNSEDLPLLAYVNGMNTAETSFQSASPMHISTQISEPSSTFTRKEKSGKKHQSTSSQAHHPVSHSQCRGIGRGLKTTETVSQKYSSQLKSSDPNSSASKMSEACSLAPTDQDLKSDTLQESSISFPPAGTMSSGKWSAQDTLPAPSLESGCSWLESPGALSSTGRSPGLNRLESSLVKQGVLRRGEVLNPIFLEESFAIPKGWTDPSEHRAATALLEDKGKPSAIVSILAWHRWRWLVFCTLIAFWKNEISLTSTALSVEEWLEPRDVDCLGKAFYCDTAEKVGTVTHFETIDLGGVLPDIRYAHVEWWWGKPKRSRISADELELVEELSCPLPETSTYSLEKPETHTSKQTGSLYQYTANKTNKLGVIHTYPKVEGERKREEPGHWYWGFSYVEKELGKWRDKSAAVPRKKLKAVQQALRNGKPYTYILQEILGKD